MKSNGILMMTLLLAACSQSQPNRDENGSLLVPNEAKPAPPPPAPHPPEPSLPEPTGEIDPKSVEAAGQVVQHYGALIEQGRWTEAEQLWGQATSAKEFTAELKRNAREVHLEIGKPGDMEGAAGSIYVTVPVSFYGKDNQGKAFRHAAEVTVRRVNDVPGSTAAQRRWHIERIQGEDTGEN